MEPKLSVPSDILSEMDCDKPPVGPPHPENPCCYLWIENQ